MKDGERIGAAHASVDAARESVAETGAEDSDRPKLLTDGGDPREETRTTGEPAGDGGDRRNDAESGPAVETDGGVATRSGSTEYLEAEVNIFNPSTSFMRDHLRVIWTGFVAWGLIVFGPVTLTAIVPDLMTTQLPVIGFPLHYFLVAIGAPGGAWLLSIWYARKRDALDDEYGIDHTTATGGPGSGGSESATATDGGAPAVESGATASPPSDGGASE